MKSFEFLGFVKVEDKKEERENDEEMKLAILAPSQISPVAGALKVLLM